MTINRSVNLRFFDVEAEIASDSDFYVDLFALMYRHFVVPLSSSAPWHHAEFVLQTESHGTWGQPALSLNGEVWPVHDVNLLNGYFYDVVLNTIIAQVRSHFLIHAGVVSWGGQGIILTGDASHGKTTLVLELVRRGFSFLSDEMAGLGRGDHSVYPFPRTLRIEPDTLARAGFADSGSDAPEWMGKLLLDIEEIQPGALGPAAKISSVIVLCDQDNGHENDSESAERELGVFVNRLDDDLLNAVRRIEGVSSVRSTMERGYPVLRLEASHRMRALFQIEEICKEQRVLILDVSKRVERRPDFCGPARLEAIPSSEAVMELLRRFQGGHKSALLQDEYDGSTAQLFLEVAETISEAQCYRLYLGPLADLADLVCSTVNR